MLVQTKILHGYKNSGGICTWHTEDRAWKCYCFLKEHSPWNHVDVQKGFKMLPLKGIIKYKPVGTKGQEKYFFIYTTTIDWTKIIPALWVWNPLTNMHIENF